jgi:hypothetical protein
MLKWPLKKGLKILNAGFSLGRVGDFFWIMNVHHGSKYKKHFLIHKFLQPDSLKMFSNFGITNLDLNPDSEKSLDPDLNSTTLIRSSA